jgi:hypothetical protein
VRQQGFRHFSGLQRLINRTDQLDERIEAIKAFLQSICPVAKACGEICLSAAWGGRILARCSGHRRFERKLP